MRIWNKQELIQQMAKLTPGYVPADLQTLCKEASIQAMSWLSAEFKEQSLNCYSEETGQF